MTVARLTHRLSVDAPRLPQITFNMVSLRGFFAGTRLLQFGLSTQELPSCALYLWESGLMLPAMSGLGQVHLEIPDLRNAEVIDCHIL
jgi:hypothetical protein